MSVQKLQQEASRAIIVLGMHRSGTSLVTRGLNALDVELGDALLNPLADNPKGFFEDKDIVRINDELLAIYGRVWDSVEWDEISDYVGEECEELREAAKVVIQERFIPSKLWGFKDPRTARLLGFWLPLLEEIAVSTSFVIVIRHPSAVANSLARRNWFSSDKSYLMWLEHMKAAIEGVGLRSAIVVDYDLMLAEPERQLLRIADQLAIVEQVNREDVHSYAEEFVDPGLRHASTSAMSYIGLVPLAKRCYQLLKRVFHDEVSLDSEALQCYQLLKRVAHDEISLDSEAFSCQWKTQIEMASIKIDDAK